MTKKNTTPSQTTAIAMPLVRPAGAMPFHSGASWKFWVSVVTEERISGNYRGESVGNRVKLQVVRKDGMMYAIIGSSAIRNGVREGITEEVPIERINRARLYNQDQLAVGFRGPVGLINAIDDLLMGYLVTDSKECAERRSRGQMVNQRSSFACNCALALNTVAASEQLTVQVPLTVDREGLGNANASHSSLLEIEVAFTGFQYLWAFDTYLFEDEPDAIRAVCKVMGHLANVAGNHARTLFDLSPAAMIGRLTKARTMGCLGYNWQAHPGQAGQDNVQFTNPEIARLNARDLLHPSVCADAGEWFVAGQVLRAMDPAEKARLAGLGVNLEENPTVCLNNMAETAIAKIAAQK